MNTQNAQTPALTYQILLKAVMDEADLVSCRMDVDVDEDGAIVAPPTYDKGEVAKWQENGKTSAILDSFAGQANRAEESLLWLIQNGDIKMPLIRVQFSSDELDRCITNLEAPHRGCDAYFRQSDALEDGVKVEFRQSKIGKEIYAPVFGASNRYDARGVFMRVPSDLLFGMWDSNGLQDHKHPRGYTGFIYATGASEFRAPQSRIDPLNLVMPIGRNEYYLTPNKRMSFEEVPGAEKVSVHDEDGTSLKKDGKSQGLSKLGLGNIPPDLKRTMLKVEKIFHKVNISLPALRRFNFGSWDAQQAARARTYLVSIGVLAATTMQRDTFIRSGFQIRYSSAPVWIIQDGHIKKSYALAGSDEGKVAQRAAAIKIYEDAVAELAKVGIVFDFNPVTLTPSKALLEIAMDRPASGSSKSQRTASRTRKTAQPNGNGTSAKV